MIYPQSSLVDPGQFFLAVSIIDHIPVTSVLLSGYVCVWVCVCVCVLVTQLYLTLCDPIDCGPPDSSIHGILQARILEWVTIPFSGGSS